MRLIHCTEEEIYDLNLVLIVSNNLNVDDEASVTQNHDYVALLRFLILFSF